MNYKSKKWKELRERILRRDGYRCQYYKRFGRSIPANTVHHCVPVSDRPDLMYESKLMVSLSQKAHNIMHDRNTDELTEEGLKLAERVIKNLTEDERKKLCLKK